MTTVRSLHAEAMQLSQQALVARHTGREDEAEVLAQQALALEKQAVNLVPNDASSEPTRSILYLSAASLAYQAKQFVDALDLISEGLAGTPPSKIKHELLELRNQVNFELNLQEQDVVTSRS